MRLLFFLSVLLIGLSPVASGRPPALLVARDIPHAVFGKLLATYLDPAGRVDYAGWRKNPKALRELDRYIASFAVADGPAAEGGEQMASWINLYHACLLREILQRPRLASPKGDTGFFSDRRHLLGTTAFSLEDLGEGNIIPLLGWRGRGILHLGCYGGPPLPPRPVERSSLDMDIDSNWRQWLSSPEHFQADTRTLRLSSMFLWYRSEFEPGGGFRGILPRYVTPEAAALLPRLDLHVEYLPFDWTLSAAGNPPRTYALGHMLRDRWWPW